MKLDNQLFRSVVSALRSSRSEGNKRVLPRVGLTAEVNISFVIDDHVQPMVSVRVRDLSRSGIGFLHSVAIPMAARVILQLPVPGQRPRFVLCVVKHCRPVAANLFAIGAVFIDQDYARAEQCAANAPAAMHEANRIRDAILK